MQGGTDKAVLRVYCENVDDSIVQVEMDGVYREVASTVVGSYREFTLEMPGSFRVVETETGNTKVLVLCVATGAAGILLLILAGKKIARRHKRTGDGGKEEQ